MLLLSNWPIDSRRAYEKLNLSLTIYCTEFELGNCPVPVTSSIVILLVFINNIDNMNGIELKSASDGAA